MTLPEDAVNELARWMIRQGFSTGHGDTITDLLKELEEQMALRTAKPKLTKEQFLDLWGSLFPASSPDLDGIYEQGLQTLEWLYSLPSTTEGWRELLWVRHGCGLSDLYGDDGEMQCSRCGIDFKRWTPEQIGSRWEQLAGISKPEER